MRSLILLITALTLIGCSKEEVQIEPLVETCETRLYRIYRTIEGPFVVVADWDNAFSNRDTLMVTNDVYEKYVWRFGYTNDKICFRE